MNDEIKDQPPPTPTTGPSVWDLVIEDFRQRDQLGRERYGTPLQVDNGRDHLVDGYQEAMDLVVYLRAEIEKRRKVKEMLAEFITLSDAGYVPPAGSLRVELQKALDLLGPLT